MHCRRRRYGLRTMIWCALMGAAASYAGAAPADAFDRVFAVRGEPASLRYEVDYEDARGSHRLRVWRHGTTHLRRSTDGMLDVLVERGADDELHMAVIDHRKHIATAVSRTALYKVGHGLDWFSLAHGLARPATAYTVTRLARAPASAPAVAACRWAELTQGERRTDVCWSPRLGLPLLIVAQPSGKTVWRVVASHPGPVEASAFSVAADGYVRVSADEDIQAD